MFRAARGMASERLKGAVGTPSRFSDADWKACASFGLLGLCLPTAYGGMGLDLLTTARTIEGFGAGTEDMGLAFSACAHLFACAAPIATHGTEELRGRMLPRLASGEWVGANAITESEAGSDVFALRARAERDGDSYRLNGSKIYVTNGPVADVAVVYAATNPGAGMLSISAFAVELDLPGVVVGPPLAKTGLSSSPVGSVYFEDCAVPVASRLGGEGQGALVFEASMKLERSCLFAAYLGAMQRQLDEVVEFAESRRQFGRPIGKNQAVSHRVVDMKLRLEAARHLLYYACWAVDCGARDATLAVALAKLAVSEAAVQSGIDAIQIHGGLGVMAEAGIGRGLHDALPATIFSGTSDMQREIAAAQLGL
jgi:alkylation response protein AidB-like acyl-CoA dehydrogenase